MGQPRILLMDIDVGRAAHLCGLFSEYGWHVMSVGSPREALEAVDEFAVDAAVLCMAPSEAADIDLPGALRRKMDGVFLPVVVLTDDDAPEAERCRCLESGADELLPQSVSPGELWARLRSLLRIKMLQDALDDSRHALREALRREHELLMKLQTEYDQLSLQVVTDPLTRLYNVRYFQRFLADEFSIARRYGHSLGLLMLDLDHFKQVNDQHGHPVGDFVLKEFSVIMRQCVRDSDVVARTGGEEFSIVLPRCDRVQIDAFARRIRETVARHPFQLGSTKVKVTCSIGLASFPQDADVTSPQHLIYFADQALLQAKQSGRNCVVHWFELDESVKSRLRGQIRSVLDSQEATSPETRASAS